MKSLSLALSVLLAPLAALHAAEAAKPEHLFNRAPLQPKPYAELPLGTIKPEGWLREELLRMAGGMSGHLDDWYPEVCGARNAWLGGDGDTWERGPYWIDGLYPLARLLDDQGLQAKAQQWIDWTLTHQRADGYIGPVELKKAARTQPPPRGAQIGHASDWWPRMVMLKILQQHYDATGDPRVVTVLDKYFRYQLRTLPAAPLHDPGNPKSGSYWAAQRGADNLMVVLWFYNLTGEKYLLELADLLQQQTIPLTDWFEHGKVLQLQGQQKKGAENTEACPFHGVNLAQAMKTPLVEFQRDGSPRHLAATRKGLADLRAYHGQPYGLYGADEHMHGPGLDRGSELCTAVEMMFSLEKMLEISGAAEFADQLEQIAFNVLPTQVSDDQCTRQYFSQANQVVCAVGDSGFYDNHAGKNQVYGLLNGYPCCTCNLHQGWPKFAQHLWMASADGGLAALAYAPSRVTTTVAKGQPVTIREETFYPFDETVRFKLETAGSVEFPLHLRIPGWCHAAQVSVNGKAQTQTRTGSIVVLRRAWQNGDVVELILPMVLRTSAWDQHSVAIERGPLLYALRVEETWSVVQPAAPAGTPDDKPERGLRECRPASPWNYALLESKLKDLEHGFEVVRSADTGKKYPWNLADAPLELRTTAVRLPAWTTPKNSAGIPPASPQARPTNAADETIRLIPYGCTTLRISGFPWIGEAQETKK